MGCTRSISFSWSSGQSHLLHNMCAGCAFRAQGSSAFLAHHWKWGLSQDCGLREGDRENLVSQLKGFVSSDCLTCYFLYTRQNKSPKASVCGFKTVLARRGHPVTLKVHGVPCFIISSSSTITIKIPILHGLLHTLPVPLFKQMRVCM